MSGVSRARGGTFQEAQLRRLLSFVEGGIRRDGPEKEDVKEEVAPPTPQTPKMPRARTFYLHKLPTILVGDLPETPRSARMTSRGKAILGGEPITLETAKGLREVVCGSTVHSFSADWRNAVFRLQNIDGPYPYGLTTPRNGTRGLIMCLQAHLIKNLMFRRGKTDNSYSRQIMNPSAWERQHALIRSISDILWRAGEKQQCTVCLRQDKACFPPNAKYRTDGITEKLHVYQFRKYDDLVLFIRRNISNFDQEGSFGCILLLYSTVLSRGIQKVREDGGDDRLTLLTGHDECSRPLINLLLTGKAVNYLHNGHVVYNDEGELMELPSKGVTERCDVGYLWWHKDEIDKQKTQVGSMLKTPRTPIWVSHVNGNFGVLFSTNPDLVSDWRVEHKFTLHYYTGLSSQTKDIRLTVDTRYGRRGFLRSARYGRAREEQEKRIPPLEQCIMTKWYGAEVDWNGTSPVV